MGRKKVTMTLIPNRSVRSTTFKKRRSSLLKKASELSLLCSLPVCVVVSVGPDDPSAIVWPSKEKAAQILSMANNKLKGKNRNSTKLSRQIAEMQEQLQNLNGENLRLEAMLQMRFKEVEERIENISFLPEVTSCSRPSLLRLFI